MSFSKYSDLNVITDVVNIDNEILILQKNLFDLRMKRATNQAIKPHLFIFYKRRLKQLKFKKASLLKSS